MIANRYIKKELLFNTFAITLVLLSTLILYAFVRYVKYIIEGKIPAQYVFELIGLEIPNTLSLLLGAGLFAGFIITLAKFHSQKELIVWFASGLSPKKLLKLFSGHIIFICVIISVLAFWLAPHSLSRLHYLKHKLSTSILSSFIMPGQFNNLVNTDYVLFAQDNLQNGAKNVFLANIANNQVQHIITSKAIKVNETKSAAMLEIDSGKMYGFDNAIEQIQFEKIIKSIPLLTQSSKSVIKSQSIYSLLFSKDIKLSERMAELHFRLSLPISAFILAFTAFGLVISVNISNKYYLILPATVIYMLYYNLIIFATELTRTGAINPYIGNLWVHLIFFVIMFLSNLTRYKYAR